MVTAFKREAKQILSLRISHTELTRKQRRTPAVDTSLKVGQINAKIQIAQTPILRLLLQKRLDYAGYMREAMQLLTAIHNETTQRQQEYRIRWWALVIPCDKQARRYVVIGFRPADPLLELM